jgi:predicted RNA-binding Zn ribbon-like protein
MTGENLSKEHAMTEPQPGGREPAPPQLWPVQSFLNTRWDLADERKGETFTSPRALGGWLAHHGLIGGRTRMSQEDLDRALTVREGLRALAFANNGQALDPGPVDALRAASRGASTGIRIEPDGPQFVTDALTGLEAALGALFAMTARAMIDGSWQRLKACPGRNCGWVFYDRSRNHTARWCSTKVCGDREKSRSYYQRRTASKP